METRVSSKTRELVISGNGPTTIIGERIHPTGKKKLAESLKAGRFDVVRQEAVAQVAAGADILDVNVAAPDHDEAYLLPKAIEVIMSAVDVPPLQGILPFRQLNEYQWHRTLSRHLPSQPYRH